MRHHKGMWFRLRILCLALAGALAAGAQTKMNLDELKQMISSSLALKHDDKKVAEYLKHVQLTERLTDPMIEQFMAMGAGARTIHELQVLRDETAKLTPAKGTTMAAEPDEPPMELSTKQEYKPIPPPDSVTQAKILDLFREYALNYTRSLPNFICLQVTDRFVYSPREARERKIDKLVAQLSYSDGHENYKMLSQNGQYLFTDMDKVQGGSISSGEFGSMMSKIFEPQSEAQFDWFKWGTLRGQRVAEFSYHIDSGHSAFSISFDNTQRIITAYRGVIEGDAETGIIYRISFEAVDIPAGFPVRQATDILDYGEVDISGNPSICPLKAELRMMAQVPQGEQKTHNEIAFKLYRKFGVNSSITYSADDLKSENDKAAEPAGKGDVQVYAPDGTPLAPPPPPTKPTSPPQPPPR